jgi:hypothetical protein
MKNHKFNYKMDHTLEKKIWTPTTAHFSFPLTGLLTVGLANVAWRGWYFAFKILNPVWLCFGGGVCELRSTNEFLDSVHNLFGD